MENFENQLTFTRFYEICHKYSSKIALIYLGQKYSYGSLERLVDKFATGLSNLGVKKGDKVMLYI
jgi:long-chain acyl-CoA synthetase